ncbi:MAG: hypothetical protein VKL97_05240 [Cyanobacteriota bacterium]|nr:hypothetical protein [Cyanobacteriota bacterium]
MNGALGCELPPSDLLQMVAQAADLCLKPWRHSARFADADAEHSLDDATIRIEARDASGQRCVERDLELEIYRSGDALNLMIQPLFDARAPLLWHGSHPVWMASDTGERIAAPDDASGLEAFSRRLRALLVP